MAYIAGVFDGDGSFSLIKKLKKDLKNPYFYPQIQLANVSKDLVDFLVGEIGGSYTTRAEYVAKDGSKRKICYGWKLSRSNACLPFLENVRPYLIVKKERADFLADFLIENPYVRNNKPDDSLYVRENAYIRMRTFNNSRDKVKKFPPRKRTVNTLDNAFWAYVAGLMDTDGSFSVKKEQKRSRRSPTYTPVILLSMIDIDAMNYIYENTTIGNFNVLKARSASTGYCYRFSIFSKNDVILFLEKVIPFLIVKKEQGKALMEFCKNMNPVRHCQIGISEDELNIREKFYQKVKQLNNYGVYKPSLIDLEGYSESHADKAEGVSHRDRLSEMGS